MRILENNISQLTDLLKALSDETRLRILNLLIERECCVCEVMQALDISQTRASRNLSQLHDAGLLEQRREGLWTIYFLASRFDTDYRNLIISAIEKALTNDDRGAADRQRLRESERLCPPTGEPSTTGGGEHISKEGVCPNSSSSPRSILVPAKEQS